MYINFRGCLAAYKQTTLGGVRGGEGNLKAQRDVSRKKKQREGGVVVRVRKRL